MRRLVVLMLAGIIAAALFAAGPAHAGIEDGPDAVLSNTQDQINDALDWVGPDITCKPEADGGPITQETNFIVGKVFAQDFGVGRGTCVSLNVPDYTVDLVVKIQYYCTPADDPLGDCPNQTGWRVVRLTGCEASRTARAVAGVGVVVPPIARCNYGDLSPYLDKYHRARSTLWNSVDGKFRRASSATWFMRRG